MTEQTKFGVSRRTLAKGAAWSVPAVAVVAAAPAYAKSGIIDPSFTPGTFCKHPGGRYSYYHAGFCFKNTSNVDVTISFDSFTVNETTVTAMHPSTLTVKAGEECCLNIDGYGFGDSANGTGTLAFSYEYGGTTIDGSVSTASTNDLPPCSNIGQEHSFADTPAHKDIKCGTPAEARQRRTWAKTSEADSTELDADEPVEADKADTPVEKAAEAPKTEAPKAEEPAPAPEPKAEEPAPAPEPSEPADEA